MSDVRKDETPQDRKRWSDRDLRDLTALALLVVLPITTLCMVAVVRVDIPWGDDVNIIREMRFDQDLRLSTLFKFSNEHQILFTRLTLLADYVLFNGANILTAVVAVLLAISIPLACAASFRCLRVDPIGNRELLLIGAFLSTVYFNGNILWPLTSPVLVGHLFAAAFAIVAGYAFSLLATGAADGTARGSGSYYRSLAATFVVAAAMAALSGANGLLIVPTALVVCLVHLPNRTMPPRPARSTLIVLLLVCTIALIGPYYFLYRASRVGHGPVAAEHPSVERLVQFVVHFIGGPFWRESTWPMASHPNPDLVLLTCAAFCALLVWVSIGIFRRRKSLTAFEVFHFFLIVLVVLTAVAGAANRSEFSAAEGLNKKYPPTSLLAWLSVSCLLVDRYASVLFTKERKCQDRIIGIAAASVKLILPSNLIEFHVWRYWRDRLQETAAMTASGVFNEALMGRLYYDHPATYNLIQGVFRPAGAYFTRDFPPPPYPVTQRYVVVPSGAPQDMRQVHIEAQRQRADASGYIGTGVLPYASALSRFSSLVAVDAHGDVVGYGHLSTVSDTLPKWGFARRPPQVAALFIAFRSAADTPHVVIYGDDSGHLAEIARIQHGATER